MKVEARATFERDLKKIKDKAVKQQIRQIIHTLVVAENLSQIPHVKKLKGHNQAYRIRLGNYRLGFYYDKDVLSLSRCKHRKEIYQYFPK